MNEQNQLLRKPADLLPKSTCSECGAPMVEVERVKENGFFFIWYECSRQNYNGQWLEKKSALPSHQESKIGLKQFV